MRLRDLKKIVSGGSETFAENDEAIQVRGCKVQCIRTSDKDSMAGFKGTSGNSFQATYNSIELEIEMLS